MAEVVIGRLVMEAGERRVGLAEGGMGEMVLSSVDTIRRLCR